MIVLQSHTAAVWEAVMSRQKTCPKMCKTRPKGRLSAEPREEQNPQAGLQQRAFVMGSPTAQGLETFFPAQGTLTWLTPSVTWSRREVLEGILEFLFRMFEWCHRLVLMFCGVCHVPFRRSPWGGLERPKLPTWDGGRSIPSPVFSGVNMCHLSGASQLLHRINLWKYSGMWVCWVKERAVCDLNESLPQQWADRCASYRTRMVLIWECVF